jgi:cell division septation protein DedD
MICEKYAVRNRHSPPDVVLEPEQQYAVVLLNEQQLSQFMHKPGMRQVNRGYSVPDVHTRYLRLKRQTAAAAVVLLLLGGGSFLYFMAPQPAMASMFAFKELPESPTLDTGASFSVTVQTTDSGDGAGFAANRVRTLGFPSFTRVTPGRRQVHQAMVGPYASLDEAERVQRRLTRSGFPAARIFVDESLRNAPRNQVDNTGVVEGNPNVLLIGAPDRLSVVFELPTEPRQVRSRRVENVLDLDAGPMFTKIAPQQWSAPEGVHLIERVSIEGVQASETGDFLRAHITVPEFARANVRAEGRRIYVDVTWPMVAPDAVAPSPAPVAASAERGPAQPPKSRDVPVVDARQDAGADAYAEQLRGVTERLEEVRPFLMSAAKSGSPDVLRALDDTLSGLEANLRGLRAPAASVDQHQMFLSSIRAARKVTDLSFSGDRTAQAHEAFVLYDAAVNAGSLITPAAR